MESSDRQVLKPNGHHASSADFWSIGADCTGLWIDYSVSQLTRKRSKILSLTLSPQYCVMGPGWQNTSYQNASSNAPTSTASSVSVPASSTASVSGPPGPTQSGIASDCSEYYVAVSGDTCDAIATTYDITFATFLKLNPAVGSKSNGVFLTCSLAYTEVCSYRRLYQSMGGRSLLR